MRQLKLLILTAIALCALGAVTAASVQAEEPVLLCFPEGCLTGLEGHFKEAAKNDLATLGGKELAGSAVEGKIKECKELGTSKKDTTLCKVSVTFTGVKQGKVACRSESSSGEKKAIEEVVFLADLHLAGELTLPSNELQPLALFKILGQVGEETELTINCGGVKNKVKGVLACLLLPGLKTVESNIEKFEIVCAQGKTSHDPETGMCELLCEWLSEAPFESNLGAGFEDAGAAFVAKGAFNREVFIDD